MGGIWALFDRAETVLKDDLRDRLGKWLTNKSESRIEKWTVLFIEIFDSVFGKPRQWSHHRSAAHQGRPVQEVLS